MGKADKYSKYFLLDKVGGDSTYVLVFVVVQYKIFLVHGLSYLIILQHI